MSGRFFFIAAAVLVASGFFDVTWAGPDMNPGEWEITTKTEMVGMPPQSLTHVQCITPDAPVPVSRDANQECRVEDVQTNGNTVSWKISCGGEGGGMTGTGQITYGGDNMNGIMNMTISPYGTQVKNTLSGHRIGDCDGASANAAVPSTGPEYDASGNVVAEALSEDVKDVGQAARDEVKQSAAQKAREGVRGVFNGLFKK